jgi:hypothetical protein
MEYRNYRISRKILYTYEYIYKVISLSLIVTLRPWESPLQNFEMEFREFIGHTFQFLVEAVLHVISYLLLGHERSEQLYDISDLLVL